MAKFNARLKRLEKDIAPKGFDDYTIFFDDVPFDDSNEGYEEFKNEMRMLENHEDETTNIIHEYYIKGKQLSHPILFLSWKDIQFIVAQLREVI